MAAFLDRYFSEESLIKLNTAIGAAATGASARLSNFEKAVVNFHKALNRLRGQVESGKYGQNHETSLIDAKHAVQATFVDLSKPTLRPESNVWQL